MTSKMVKYKFIEGLTSDVMFEAISFPKKCAKKGWDFTSFNPTDLRYGMIK